ncbi:MAG: hypothetical protein ACI8TP_004986, partial [Acidimicrobiales bacterium]
NRVHLNRVHLNRVHLNRVHLNRVHLNRVHLNRVHLNRVHLNRPDVYLPVLAGGGEEVVQLVELDRVAPEDLGPGLGAEVGRLLGQHPLAIGPG